MRPPPFLAQGRRRLPPWFLYRDNGLFDGEVRLRGREAADTAAITVTSSVSAALAATEAADAAAFSSVVDAVPLAMAATDVADTAALEMAHGTAFALAATEAADAASLVASVSVDASLAATEAADAAALGVTVAGGLSAPVLPASLSAFTVTEGVGGGYDAETENTGGAITAFQMCGPNSVFEPGVYEDGVFDQDLPAWLTYSQAGLITIDAGATVASTVTYSWWASNAAGSDSGTIDITVEAASGTAGQPVGILMAITKAA